MEVGHLVSSKCPTSRMAVAAMAARREEERGGARRREEGARRRREMAPRAPAARAPRARPSRKNGGTASGPGELEEACLLAVAAYSSHCRGRRFDAAGRWKVLD